MKHSRFIVALVVCLMATAFANAQNRYCLSLDDYHANRWTDLPTLQVSHRSASKKAWWGGGDVSFDTGDKALDKKLVKEAFIIENNDTMYINCRQLTFDKALFGKGFVHVYPYREEGALLFVQQRVGNAATSEQTTAMMFGLIGGIAAVNSLIKNPVCYLVKPHTLPVKGRYNVKILDDQAMQYILADHPEELKLFNSVKKKKLRENAANVLDVFKKLGWVKL